MPTVIDTLLIQLGFNSDKFVDGQKKAQDSLKKTREEATRHAKELQSEIGDKLSEAFQKATTRVLEFMAALAGARTLESFVSQTVAAGNALGMMATALGMSPGRLSAFEAAITRSGGSAEQAAASLKKLNDLRLAVTNESAPVPRWAQGVNLSAARNGEDVLKQLVDRAKGDHLDEQTFMNRAGTLGVDAYTAKWAFDRGSSKGIDEGIDAQTGVAWTKAQIEAAEKLRTAWVDASNSVASFARTILVDVEPALSKLLAWVDDLVRKSGPNLEGWIGDKIKEVAEAIQKVDWKGVGKTLDGYLDKVQKIVTALGGWEDAGKTFLELWAGYKIAQVIAVIGELTGALVGLRVASGFGALGGPIGMAIAGGLAMVPHIADPETVAKNYANDESFENKYSRPIREFLYGFITGTNPKGERLFKNMRGRGMPSVSENNPLPVKIIGAPGSTAPDAAGLPTTSEAGAPAADSNNSGSSGGGLWGSVKRFFGLGGTDAATTGGTLPVTGSTADVAAGLKAAYPHLTTGQCVELAQVMNGVGSVNDWRRGASVMETRPPVGTAVSTFGWNGDSNLYAYGGGGTPGIGRDHAGIIAGYDDTGMILLNQWEGHSPRYTHYPWPGYGERGGQNYYIINGRNGLPAGKNGQLLAPKPSVPNVSTGARGSAHSREHERLSMSQGKTSVQIGALNFSASAGSRQSSAVDEQMNRALFVSRADYGLA